MKRKKENIDVSEWESNILYFHVYKHYVIVGTKPDVSQMETEVILDRTEKYCIFNITTKGFERRINLFSSHGSDPSLTIRTKSEDAAEEIKECLIEYILLDPKETKKKPEVDPILKNVKEWFVSEFYATIKGDLKYQWEAKDTMALKRLIKKCRNQILSDHSDGEAESVVKNFFFLVGKYVKSGTGFLPTQLDKNFTVGHIDSRFNTLWPEIGKTLQDNERTKSKLAAFIQG